MGLGGAKIQNQRLYPCDLFHFLLTLKTKRFGAVVVLPSLWPVILMSGGYKRGSYGSDSGVKCQIYPPLDRALWRETNSVLAGTWQKCARVQISHAEMQDLSGTGSVTIWVIKIVATTHNAQEFKLASTDLSAFLTSEGQ